MIASFDDKFKYNLNTISTNIIEFVRQDSLLSIRNYLKVSDKYFSTCTWAWMSHESRFLHKTRPQRFVEKSFFITIL